MRRMLPRTALPITLLCGLAFAVPSGVHAQPWMVGDVFFGVGIPGDSNEGAYWVYTNLGEPKATDTTSPPTPLIDPDADPTDSDPWIGYTTGCVVDPFTGTFWGTTYTGRKIFGYGPSAGTPTVIDVAPLVGTGTELYPAAVQTVAFGVESAVQPGGGTAQRRVLYAGTLDRADALGDPLPTQILLKYDVTDPLVPVLLDTFELPRGYRGVSWIDISADGKTVFYTAEEGGDGFFAQIRVFDLESRAAKPSILLRNPGGGLVGNQVWAVRALPPGDGSGGFLIASELGVYRVNRFGDITETWKHLPGSNGYFALNLTPDGQHFWTSQVWSDTDVPQSFLYSILDNATDASGVGTPVRTVTTGRDIVAGICVYLEATAFLGCPQLDAAGAPVLDENDHPIFGTCPALPSETCGNGVDDDADGLVDLPCPRTNAEGDVVTPFRIVSSAAAASGQIEIAGSLPDGIVLLTDGFGNPTGQIGSTLTYASAGIHEIHVRVTYVLYGEERVAEGTLTWTVTGTNQPPVIHRFAPAPDPDSTTQSLVPQGPLAYPTTILASDPDGDAIVSMVVEGLPPGLTFTAGPENTSGTVTGAIPYDFMPAGGALSTVTVTDSQGLSASRTLRWIILDVNVAPVITAPTDTTVNAGTGVWLPIVGSDPDGDPWWPRLLAGALELQLECVPAASVPTACDNWRATGAGPTGPVSWFIAGPSPAPGVYTISFQALDGTNPTNHSFVLTVAAVANESPACPAGGSLGHLWPPNHRLVPFTLPGPTDPDGDPLVAQIAVTQDEPTQTQGDGNTMQDAFIDGLVVSLRAERSGSPKVPGNGRVYTITMIATDPSGASCSTVWTAGVPHDQGKRTTIVDDSATTRYDSVTGARLP
jgi:hypothetical protein